MCQEIYCLTDGRSYNPDMLIGYARVSTEDQNLDLQRDALRKAGCKKIFEEKESGRAGTKRPALRCCTDPAGGARGRAGVAGRLSCCPPDVRLALQAEPGP